MSMDRRSFIQLMVNGMAMTLVMPKLETQVRAAQIAITTNDIKKATLLEPGWYKVTIDTISERVLERNQDQIIGIHMSTLVDRIPVVQLISSRAPYPILDLLKKCALPEADVVDLEQCIGKEIDIRIVNETYNNRIYNRVLSEI